MDVFEAIANRHSYRGAFTGAPVPREDLTKIVSAGLAAPSGCNKQTTTFVVVDDPETLAKVEGIVKLYNPPKALIVCVVDPAPVYQGMSFEKEDCSAAVENMLLAITAMGYATVWIDGQLRTDGRAERLGDLLGVPKDRRVQVILPVGVPAESCTGPEKKPFDERAWFDTYGG
ncbi:MAG: nitroreductase family protein [Planctomycetes bacterium]|nr:nitroreductase family protein [Planctomycetota bacterium]